MKNILTFALLCLISNPIFSQGASLQFNTPTVETTVGSQFTAHLVLDANQVPVSAMDIQMMFDPQYLEVISIETLQVGLFNYHRPAAFDNVYGRITASAFQIGKTLPGDGFDIIAINFLALNPIGLTAVEHVLNDFPRTILAYAGENMLDQAGNLKVIINAAPVSIREGEQKDFGLEIWPNPGTDFAQIRFTLPVSKRVELDIYDLHGKHLKSVFSGMPSAGLPYQFEVDLAQFADGPYLCRLQSGAEYQTKIMVVAK